ncbi:MAG: T9SS type A sorting domain-containing protein, partial [Bacteroidota bacterium]
LPPPPSIGLSGPTAFCQGDSVILSAPAGFADYLWTTNDSSQDLAVFTSGSYSVQVIDNNGCLSLPAQAVAIQVFDMPPTPSISANGPIAFCEGDSVLLSGPAGFPAYLWSTGDTTSQIFLAATETVSLQVISAEGCESSLSPTVAVQVFSLPDQPIIQLNGPSSFCEGDSVELQAPPGFAGYLWSSGQQTATIMVDTAGVFQLQVVDTNGCASPFSSLIQTTLFSLPTAPGVITSGPLSFCVGDSVTLTAASGYQGYVWSNGDTTGSLTIQESDTLFVIGLDLNGCQSPPSDTQVVEAFATPASPLITPSAPLSFCEGDSITLSASPGYLSYQWSSGDTTSSIIVAQAGVFSVVGTDVNGCESGASDSLTVSLLPLPPLPEITLSADLPICQGDSVTLSGPSGFFAYVWSSGDSHSSLTVFASDSISLVVLDSNECASPASLPVSVEFVPVPDQPVVQMVGDSLLCEGDTTLLQGPSGFLTYQWNTGDSVSSLAITVGGTYSLTVADSNGCVSLPSDPIAIEVDTVPTTPIITQLTGSDSLLALPQASSYQWFLNDSLIQGANEQLLLPTEIGAYSVIALGVICQSDTSQEFNFILTSTDHEDLHSEFELFPNPNTGVFTLEGAFLKPGTYTIQIFDARGRLINKRTNWTSGIVAEQFDLRTQAEGSYVLHMTKGDKSWTMRFLLGG